jgi:hypothetical protein
MKLTQEPLMQQATAISDEACKSNRYNKMKLTKNCW